MGSVTEHKKDLRIFENDNKEIDYMLSILDKEKFDLIYLRYFKGYSFDRIGYLMCVSFNTVRRQKIALLQYLSEKI